MVDYEGPFVSQGPGVVQRGQVLGVARVDLYLVAQVVLARLMSLSDAV